MANGVKYPFGKADVRTVTTATTIADTVSDQLTYLKLSANLTGATTINITPSGVENGAQLFIEIPCGGTAYDVTFGTTYVTSAGVTGTINKTKVASFVYASGKFVHVGTQQVN
ncbi:MAG: hypothetical protein EPGJADBJ_04473 [Saprospiraceae bacterium]|nr:hypothetical protein [Saprospiraceae bacterium]